MAKKKTEPATDPGADFVKHATIGLAIHAVMCEVGYVYKSGSVTQGGNFNYASDSDMIKAVRPFMLRHGLILVPTEGMTHETIPNQGKSNHILDRVMGHYKLMHIHSEGEIPITMPGSGMDGREKGVYKGLTGAYKYVLRQVFMLETGDDAERTDEATTAPTGEALEAAKKEAYDAGCQAGRSFVIRSQYNKRDQDESYSGSGFSRDLKGGDDDAPLGSVEDVRMFCLWIGGRKPSHRNGEERAKLLAWLRKPVGQDKFEAFVRDCGVAE